MTYDLRHDLVPLEMRELAKRVSDWFSENYPGDWKYFNIQRRDDYSYEHIACLEAENQVLRSSLVAAGLLCLTNGGRVITHVVMTQSRYGTEDGFNVKLFHKDKIYPLPNTLANHFLRMGWAIKVTDFKQKGLHDEKFYREF